MQRQKKNTFQQGRETCRRRYAIEAKVNVRWVIQELQLVSIKCTRLSVLYIQNFPLVELSKISSESSVSGTNCNEIQPVPDSRI